MTVPPKIALIILNWKRDADTLECLRLALTLSYPNLETMLVDNHSQDGVCEKVRLEFPQVVVLENAENLGYAGGNNAGIRFALERGAEYVFILNNDAALAEGCLETLVAEACRESRSGILAPKVLLWDQRNKINSLGTKMDWLRLRPQLGSYGLEDPGAEIPFEAEVLMGCALFISKASLEKIGLLDERFFLIHEDADWCFRARKAGLKTWVIPQAVVFHKGSQTLKKVPDLSYYYSIRNFLFFARKHAGIFQSLLILMGGFLLILQRGALSFSPDLNQKKKTRIFFAACVDFFAGSMGPCRRDFIQ